jgi:hypothetical protein
MYHAPRCTFESCSCARFSQGEIVDPESARREVDVLMDKAVLALRRAFSSGVEIEKEMHEAVDRIMGEETKGD